MIPYKDLQPPKRFPLLTILLVTINSVIFFYQASLPEPLQRAFVYKYSVIPLEFQRGGNLPESPGLSPLWSMLTALFLHGGWLHLIGNMLYLWIFGGKVEERMGRIEFLVFYFLCGITATIAQVAVTLHSPIPLLGASGAISGILAVSLRLFPKAKIAVLVPVFIVLRRIVLPAWLILGSWIVIQLLEVSSATNAVGGQAFMAHIGGFFAGFVLMPFFLGTVKKQGRR